MKQAYFIFYDRKKIEFLHVNHYAQGSQCRCVDYVDWADFIRFINGNEMCLQCISVNPLSAFKKFANFFVHHEAAGGLVRNWKGEYLFIFRNGRWDLPKGYVDQGETFIDAAQREVEEECGLRSLHIIRSLPVTYHVFPLADDGQWALKKTHWYLMQSDDYQNITPQLNEGITHAEWRCPNNINDIKANTYGNIIQLIEQIIDP